MAVLPISYCDIDTIKELLSIGWDYCTPHSMIQYTEDYVYDNDPEHAESHKVGEIRSYNFWWTPNNEMSNMLPCIEVNMARVFILRAYDIHIKVERTVDNSVNHAYQYTLQFYDGEMYRQIESDTFDYTEEDCMLEGIKRAIKYIKENSIKQID